MSHLDAETKTKPNAKIVMPKSEYFLKFYSFLNFYFFLIIKYFLEGIVCAYHRGNLFFYVDPILAQSF